MEQFFSKRSSGYCLENKKELEQGTKAMGEIAHGL
jgi:hypothetical protein